MAWFVEYHSTGEARRMCRSIAARYGIGSSSADLHQAWYLSIRSTVDNADRRGESLPSWLDGEPAAMRYVLRALHNDAVDIERVQKRQPLAVPDEILDIDLRDPVSSTGAEEASVLITVVEVVRREVWRRFEAGELGSPQCRAERVVALALAVLELLVGTGRGRGPDTAPTEWDRVMYDALVELDPERFTVVDGRMSAAARQMKARCGNCVRSLLQELVAAQYDDRGAGV